MRQSQLEEIRILSTYYFLYDHALNVRRINEIFQRTILKYLRDGTLGGMS